MEPAHEQGPAQGAGSAHDAELDRAFRAGDEVALADLYDRWSPVVYSLALRSLDGDVAAAESVTRRVFTQAWASRESYEPGSTRFADWLVGLAVRTLAELRAAPGPASDLNVAEDPGRAESSDGAAAERLLMVDGMSHLDTSSRRVLRLALDHRLTLAEIAERTGLRVEEVRARLAGSLTELRHRREAQTGAH